MNLGMPEIIVICIAVLVLFGAKKYLNLLKA